MSLHFSFTPARWRKMLRRTMFSWRFLCTDCQGLLTGPAAWARKEGHLNSRGRRPRRAGFLLSTPPWSVTDRTPRHCERLMSLCVGCGFRQRFQPQNNCCRRVGSRKTCHGTSVETLTFCCTARGRAGEEHGDGCRVTNALYGQAHFGLSMAFAVNGVFWASCTGKGKYKEQ